MTVTGGSGNSVAEGGSYAVLDLISDFDDTVTLSGSGPGDTVTVSGGTGDSISDANGAGAALTLVGGSGNSVHEHAGGTVTETSGTSGLIIADGSGANFLLQGSTDDGVTDTGSGDTGTVSYGSGAALAVSGKADRWTLSGTDDASAALGGASNHLTVYGGSAVAAVDHGSGNTVEIFGGTGMTAVESGVSGVLYLKGYGIDAVVARSAVDASVNVDQGNDSVQVSGNHASVSLGYYVSGASVTFAGTQEGAVSDYGSHDTISGAQMSGGAFVLNGARASLDLGWDIGDAISVGPGVFYRYVNYGVITDTGAIPSGDFNVVTLTGSVGATVTDDGGYSGQYGRVWTGSAWDTYGRMNAGGTELTFNGGSGNTAHAQGSNSVIQMNWDTQDTVDIAGSGTGQTATVVGGNGDTINGSDKALVRIIMDGGTGNTVDETGSGTVAWLWGSGNTVEESGGDTATLEGSVQDSVTLSGGGDTAALQYGNTATLDLMGNSDKVYVTGQSGDSATLRNFFNEASFTGCSLETVTDSGAQSLVTFSGGGSNTVDEYGNGSVVRTTWQSGGTINVGPAYNDYDNPAEGLYNKIDLVGASGVTVTDTGVDTLLGGFYANQVNLYGGSGNTVLESGDGTVAEDWGLSGTISVTGSGASLDLLGALGDTAAVDGSGNAATLTGGSGNTVTEGGMNGSVSLAWDADDTVDIAGAGPNDSVSVLGGSGDTVNDSGSGASTVTLVGGAHNTVHEAGNGSVSEHWADSGTFSDTGSGNSISLLGAVSDSVADGGSGNTITLAGGSGSSVAESGTLADITLDWDAGTSVTVTGASDLVSFIGSANDSVTFGGTATENEFVNSAGYSADQSAAANPSHATDTIDVADPNATVYVWEYLNSDATPTVLEPTIAAGSVGTVVVLASNNISAMISAAAAFGFPASGGDPSTLGRSNDGEAASLASSAAGH